MQNDIQSQDIQLAPNTVVPYPEDELKQLETIIQYRGVLKMIADEKIASAPTVKAIIEQGSGEYEKVSGLRDFVRRYNKAVA